MRNGDLLGERYRLDEFVDGGAMGEVWRATDTRLNRTVAVKVLHASLSGSRAFRRRFETEARSAAGLRAPGVVNVYDFGEDFTEDGASSSYLVMEYVDGRPLSAILAEKTRLPAGDVMALVAKVATALESAHRAGVIHRDIKPGNILLTEDGTVKVVDFGIARAQGEAGLTSTGQVMGTVAYVSPEQLYDEELSGVSDIYSLGVVAYECLAGRKPFNADAPAAVIRSQLHEAPPPLPSSVPAPVSDVVMKCLAKDAAQRWESGAVLARQCRELASQLPQGDSTEEMTAADLDDDDDVTVRVAAPGHSAVTGTRAMGAASRDEDATALAKANKTKDPDADRKRKKMAMIVAAALLGLLVLTGAAWGMWPSADNNKGGSADETTTSTTKDKSTKTDDTTNNTWEDGDYTQDPSSSGTGDPSTSNGSTSSDDNTSSDDDNTSSSDDPTDPTDSSGEPSSDEDDELLD